MRRIIEYGIAAVVLVLALYALMQPQRGTAQIAPGSGVQVFGPVTVGNCVKWLNATTVQDAGTTC